jgi:hypothetical protein
MVDAIPELIALLTEIRWECRTRSKIEPDPSLPVLGGVQPTHHEMQVTLEKGSACARELLDWVRSLPAGILPSLPPETEAALGAVINPLEQLVKPLADLADSHERAAGRRPGQRAVAQHAARWLIWFIDRHAVGAALETRQKFVFLGMCALGIPSPNLKEHPSAFSAWFSEAEVLATPHLKVH